jgi:hypothetical protein
MRTFISFKANIDISLEKLSGIPDLQKWKEPSYRFGGASSHPRGNSSLTYRLADRSSSDDDAVGRV